MIIESVEPKIVADIRFNHNSVVGVRVVSDASSFANVFTARATSSGCDELDEIFDVAGREYNLSPDLLRAVAKVESSFSTNAVSPAGAMGIMQLMPNTARHLGVDDPFDPRQNIFGGARYLREQLDRFDGDIRLALAAYNAGWPTVQRHGGIPPFRETQAYVARVLDHLGIGGGDTTANTINHSGFDAVDGLNTTDSTVVANSGFNQNEALAQAFFQRIIYEQMDLSDNDNDWG